MITRNRIEAGGRDRRSVCLAVAVVCVIACVAGCGRRESAPVQCTMTGTPADFAAIGKAFWLYAVMDKAWLYPPMASDGAFRPELAGLRAFFADNQEGQRLLDMLAGRSGAEIGYLGFLALDDESATTLLENLNASSEQERRDLEVECHRKAPDIERLPVALVLGRLRITSECLVLAKDGALDSPDARVRARQHIPVLWEIPAGEWVQGGWVLYMDGHCDWRSYPGEFPMTKAFVERVRSHRRGASSALAANNAGGPGAEHPEGASAEQLAASPVGELAKQIAAHLDAIHIAAPESILRCDATPSLDVGGKASYHLTFGLVERVYKQCQRELPCLVCDSAPLKATKMPFLDMLPIGQLDVALIPLPSSIPPDITAIVPWPAARAEAMVQVLDLGEAQGYRWIARASFAARHIDRLGELVRFHDSLTRDLALAGGEGTFNLAKAILDEARKSPDLRYEHPYAGRRYHSIGYAYPYLRCGYFLLARSGERAVPELVRAAIADGDYSGGQALAALGTIQGDEATKALVEAFVSADHRLARAAAHALLQPPRPAARPVYTALAQLPPFKLAEGEAPPNAFAAAAARLANATPEEAPLDDYRLAFESARLLAQQPFPGELIDAERVISHLSSLDPLDLASSLREREVAIQTIIAHPDKEAVALVALCLAAEQEESIGGFSIVRELYEPGLGIAKALPREAIDGHLKHISHLQIRSIEWLLRELPIQER